MSTIADERMQRTVKLVAYNRGGGILDLQFEKGDGTPLGGASLAYPQQGQMMRPKGTSSRDDDRARVLNAALADFNEHLAEWCA